jgi:hypothetical protein
MPPKKRSGLEMLFNPTAEEQPPAPAEETAPDFLSAPREIPAPASAPADVFSDSPLAHIRVGEIRPRRADKRKREPVATYRGIPEATQNQLHRAADELNVSVGILARFLFEYGLEQIDRGALRLEPVLVPAGHTLYPAAWDEPGKRRRPKSKSRRSSQPVAYRGVPDDTRQAMVALAARLDIPVGELARCLLDYGLEQMHKGKLSPPLYEAPTTLRTLYPGEK